MCNIAPRPGHLVVVSVSIVEKRKATFLVVFLLDEYGIPKHGLQPMPS